MTRRLYSSAVLATILVVLANFGCGADDAPSAAVPSRSEDPGKQSIRDFWTLNREANRLRLIGEYEAAAETFRRCLAINSEHEDSLYYLGVSLEGSAEYAEASEAYRRIIVLNPASNRAISQLARVLATPSPGAPRDLEEAQALLARSIELNREHSGPYLSLGRLFLDAGQFVDALDAFETAAGFGSAEGSFLAGYAQLLQGRMARARELFQKVLAAEEHERQMGARGGKLEGDTHEATNATLSPLRSAAVRSLLYLRIFDEPRESHWHDITARSGFETGGGRAAWDDFDLDGDSDAVVVGPGPVRLYRNLGSEFKDVASIAGLAGLRGFWDACWGDYDADGDRDLYLIASGHIGLGSNRLFENQGNGSFRESPSSASISGERSTAVAAFADLDGDGRPELIEAGGAHKRFGALRVFRNQGGEWKETSAAWGLKAAGTLVDFALADYDSDGLVDICLVPWKKPLVLYRNEGGGRFSDVTQAAGLGGIRGQGFSTIFFDFNGDGAPDLLHTRHAGFAQVARFLMEPGLSKTEASVLLFRNTGIGGFERVRLAGSFRPLARPMGTMQVKSGDVDADGWPDLVFANGSLGGSRIEPSVVLRNLSGKGFEFLKLVSGPTGLDNFQGVSVVDIDGNGRAAFA